MPDPYAHDRSALKAEIVTRVAAGTPLCALGAESGMPCDTTVRNWRRSDAAFAADLGLALRQGAWRRRWMLDPAKAEAFLARYRTGEPIHRILADPAMPSRPVLDYWRATQALFAEEVHRLKGVHEPNRLRGLRRVKTPTPWDADVADRILVRLVRGEGLKAMLDTDPTLPGLGVVARWRREQPEFDAELRAAIRIGRRRHGPAAGRCARLTETIISRIAEGASLCSLGKEPDMPCRETLYRWVRERLDFAVEVAAACEAREEWLADQILAIAETATPGTVTATRQRMAPLNRQLARLRHRPGWKRRRAAE